MQKTKIVFFGSTPLSGACLLKLLSDLSLEVVCVVCQKDNPKAKKSNKYSIVKKIALENNLVCLQPNKIADIFDEIKKMNAKIGVCVAYGQFIPQKIIDLFLHGIINVHPSLLPKYRGGAPIQHAIWNGDLQTGITIMKIVKEMDAGDYCFQTSFPVDKNWTSGDLMQEVIKKAPDILLECITKILNYDVTWTKQDDSKKTYAPILTRDQEHINWFRDSKNIVNHIKAFSPIPGTFSYFGENKTIKFFNGFLGDHKFQNKCGTINLIDKRFICVQAFNENCVHITNFLLPGKKAIEVKNYNGNYPFSVGDILF